jgi:hypothetical protein
MSSLELRQRHSEGGNHQDHQDRKTSVVKVRSRVTSTRITARQESLMTDSTEGNGNARVSAGRFASSHVERIWNFQSSEFGGMDAASVISAGSLGSPRVDLLSLYLDIHRVASVNLLNPIPSDSDLFQGICNRDSFIEEGHLGADKGQMEGVADQSAPRARRQSATSALCKETLSHKSGAENVDSASKEVTTSRTVHLRITHTSSLSRKVLR